MDNDSINNAYNDTPINTLDIDGWTQMCAETFNERGTKPIWIPFR